MDLTMIDPIWWIVLGTSVVIAIGLLTWSGRRKAARTKRLKGQFKSEYDRTASSASRKKAEADLERRSALRGRIDLAGLDETDIESLEQQAEELVRSFVDGPEGAALGMTKLVGRIATARGYVATERSVLDLVSVDHPEQVAAMRRSAAGMEDARGADLTEASRWTVLDARVLAERLLAEGRAAHLGVDEEVTPAPAAPPEQAAPSSSEAPPPPPAPEGPRAPGSNPGSAQGATVAPPANDDPPSGATAGTSLRR